MSPRTKPKMPPGTYWEPILGRYIEPTDSAWTKERYEQIVAAPKENSR